MKHFRKQTAFISGIAVVLFSVLITSCQSSSLDTPGEGFEFSHYSRSEYDNHLDAFANAVSSALIENRSFRNIIKGEVNRQFDGDFDILYTNIADLEVSVQDTKGVDCLTSVSNLLADYIPGRLTKAESGNSFLKLLSDTYPNLQISVPVHSEDWNDEYVPVVAFIPEGFRDGIDTELPAYDSNGRRIAIDAIHEPDEPVVVIGMNERMPAPNSSVPELLSNPEPPTNVSAIVTNGGILLTWQGSNDASSYKIYRKAESESDFSQIGTSFRGGNRTYTDNAITASTYYNYYVTTIGLVPVDGEDSNLGSFPLMMEVESAPSSIVTIQAPPVPQALSYFEAFCSGSGVELRWNNDGSVNHNVAINYQDPASSLTYLPLITLPATSNYYTFNSPIKGRRVVYQAFKENAIGHSDPVYDYIYPPYRNVDELSPVIAASIYIRDINDVEPWYRGKPEFELKVFGVTPQGNTIELCGSIILPFTERQNREYFNTLIYQWAYETYGGWYSALTFYMKERDNQHTSTFTANGKYAQKLTDNISLELGLGYQTTWTHSGEDCGSTYIMYYQNPSQTLPFPNYGVTLYVR